MAIKNATTVPIRAGKTPDLLPGRPGTSAPVPLELPRLVMRRALVVAVAFLVLLLMLGAIAARIDTRDEIAGALAFARMERQLHALPDDDAAALASLRGIGEPRHVRLRVLGADGRVLFGAGAASPGGLAGRLERAIFGADTAATEQTVSWTVPRRVGGPWTAQFVASPESERHEALSNLLGLFVLLAAGSAAMLAVMRWNVQRAFRPLRELLAAIGGIERQDAAGVLALPTMPIRELEAIAGALKQVAASLDRAEAARRTLSQKILGLQEDERQRLARELHDEFGQRLTGLRVDVAWLQRTAGGDPATAQVLAGMSEQIARIQADVRDTLSRLQPFAGDADEPETAARLARRLEALAAGVSRPGDGALACEARVTRRGTPADAALAGLRLPAAVQLALYRISQEAITNALRHAAGRRVRIAVDIDDRTPGACVVHWSASDDGAGLARPESALQRGSGLAGIRERVWALAGEFAWTPSGQAPWTGLRLDASLPCPLATADAP